MLLPRVSLIVPPLLRFIGDAGTIPPCDPDVAPADGIDDPFIPFAP